MITKVKISNNSQASITVEASLVLPIFIYAIVAFLYFLQILFIQENIQSAITQTGEFAVQYAFIYDYIQTYGNDDNHNNSKANGSRKENVLKEYFDVKSLGISAFYHGKMREYINEYLIDNSCVIDGVNGISLVHSKFLEENDMIEVTALYHIKLPVPIFIIKNIPVIQAVKLRAFTGYKPIGYQIDKNDENREDKIVYITRTGKVYHLNRDCTYIKFNISESILQNIGEKRNENGGKYYACESCARNKDLDTNATIYITSDGNRFHSTLSCNKLKRSVIEILLSKVQGRPACSRCGGHGDERGGFYK